MNVRKVPSFALLWSRHVAFFLPQLSATGGAVTLFASSVRRTFVAVA